MPPLHQVHGPGLVSQGLCSFCGEPVDTAASAGHYKKVQGWARMRAKGGLHEVALREDLGEYMHRQCFDLFKSGVSPDQESLF